jgi:hypothetical protein
MQDFNTFENDLSRLMTKLGITLDELPTDTIVPLQKLNTTKMFGIIPLKFKNYIIISFISFIVFLILFWMKRPSFIIKDDKLEWSNLFLYSLVSSLIITIGYHFIKLKLFKK